MPMLLWASAKSGLIEIAFLKIFIALLFWFCFLNAKPRFRYITASLGLTSKTFSKLFMAKAGSFAS